MDKSKIGNYLLIVALCVACFFVGYHLSKKNPKEVIKYELKIDTLYQDRKVIEKEIVYKTKWRDKLKEQEQNIVIPDTCKEIVHNLKQQLDNCDSIVQLKDKVIYITDEIIVEKDKIIEVKSKNKPFYVGGGIQNQNDKMPYSINAGFKIKDFIILGGYNTEKQSEVKILYNF